MSATRAPTAAPSNALSVWADSSRIYAELPSLPGAGLCIMAFPRTGIGLSKLLNLLYKYESSGDPYIEPTKPRDLIGSPTQHALAQSILRRNRMIK